MQQALKSAQAVHGRPLQRLHSGNALPCAPCRPPAHLQEQQQARCGAVVQLGERQLVGIRLCITTVSRSQGFVLRPGKQEGR